MSLDVSLRSGIKKSKNGSGVFIRTAGETKEITREEWDAKFPDQEPVTAVCEDEDDEIYSANITHNLSKMASEAGIYKHLWRPEELEITKASELLEPLTTGLALLRSDRERFEAFNPDNGWGSYEGLVNFVGAYLEACIENPAAEIHTWR